MCYTFELGDVLYAVCASPREDPDACAVLHERRHFARMIVRGIGELPSGEAVCAEAALESAGGCPLHVGTALGGGWLPQPRGVL